MRSLRQFICILFARYGEVLVTSCIVFYLPHVYLALPLGRP